MLDELGREIYSGSVVRTSEDAVREMRLLVTKTREARAACTSMLPSDRIVQNQQKAFYRYLMVWGQALGTLVAWHRSGLLADQAYVLIRAQLMATWQEEVVGVIQQR